MNCETATAETLASRAGVGQCSSPTADPIVSLGRWEGSLAGDYETAHNFTDKLPDGGRLVFVGIDAGYSAPFIFLSIHSGDI